MSTTTESTKYFSLIEETSAVHVHVPDSKEKYLPRFSNPLVLKKIKKCYKFALSGILSEEIPKQFPRSYLIKIFGQSQHPLTKWLRKQLLICTNEFYCFGDKSVCKEYIISTQGIQYISDILHNSCTLSRPEWIQKKNLAEEHLSEEEKEKIKALRDERERQEKIEYYKEKYGQELISGQFNYNDHTTEDKVGRLCHGFQNVKRGIRKEIQADFGYVYDYDIASAAQTLLLQCYKKYSPKKVLPAIEAYVMNRKHFREELSILLWGNTNDDSISGVKEIITSMFAGGTLSNVKECSTFVGILGSSDYLYNKINTNEFITQLRTDISELWGVIAPQMIIKKSKKISPPEKWGVYFELERMVLDSGREYMNSIQGLKHFAEHDGWVTNQRLNLEEMVEYIAQKTGYQVKIDEDFIQYLRD